MDTDSLFKELKANLSNISILGDFFFIEGRSEILEQEIPNPFSENLERISICVKNTNLRAGLLEFKSKLNAK